MTLSRLLPLLLFVPALTMADEDRNFKLTPDNFKVGSVVEHAVDKAIVLDSAVAISQEPVFPLQPNQLYLRSKKSVKEYLWFAGNAKPEEYMKLHAFSLEENHLGAREVVGLRFYASRQYKAFQDEADIYFDAGYVYSPRVSKLLFMNNGKWQVLKECAHPGMVRILSDEKDLDVTSYKAPLKGATAIYPASLGIYTFSFSAPGKLPYVDVAHLRRGELLDFKVDFPKLDSNSSAMSNLTVTAEQVQSAITLEDVETLYDTFSAEVDKNVQRVDTTEFANIYPPLKNADSLDVDPATDDYRKYVSLYSLRRSEAQKMWRAQKLGDVTHMYKVLHAKLDTLQMLPLQMNVAPDSVQLIYRTIKTTRIDSVAAPAEPVKADSVKTDSVKVDSAKVDSAKVDTVKVDSLKTDTLKTDTVQAVASKKVPVKVDVVLVDSSKVDSVKLHFATENGRVNVSWTGVVDGITPDSLAAMLADKNSPIVATLFLANNKPVWVYKEGVLTGRHHYRFNKLAFRIGDSLYVGKGKFTLPMNVAYEPEVQKWLTTKVSESPSSTIAGSSSSSAKDSAKTEFGVQIIEHPSRGTVAVIDSGSFRYRGKVVAMSPFAIHTTEVTQEFFQKAMGYLDSAKRLPDRSAFKGPQKPVQNITWDKAQYVCKVLGGDLPTEAQWEYAGRAGSNDGTLWTTDDAISVNKYAIFAGNSLKMGKEHQAYGPHDVATKLPNAWGLYDMSGNVAEWTRDNYFAITFSIEDSNPTGSYFGTNKVMKGGSWKDKPKKLNMTYRDDEDPRYWSDGIGFRCVFPLDRIIQDNKK